MLVGDVVGRTGRKAFDRYTKELRQKYNVDMVIVNGENSAGGKGISRKSMDELLRGGGLGDLSFPPRQRGWNQPFWPRLYAGYGLSFPEN